MLGLILPCCMLTSSYLRGTLQSEHPVPSLCWDLTLPIQTHTASSILQRKGIFKELLTSGSSGFMMSDRRQR